MLGTTVRDYSGTWSVGLSSQVRKVRHLRPSTPTRDSHVTLHVSKHASHLARAAPCTDGKLERRRRRRRGDIFFSLRRPFPPQPTSISPFHFYPSQSCCFFQIQHDDTLSPCRTSTTTTTETCWTRFHGLLTLDGSFGFQSHNDNHTSENDFLDTIHLGRCPKFLDRHRDCQGRDETGVGSSNVGEFAGIDANG